MEQTHVMYVGLSELILARILCRSSSNFDYKHCVLVDIKKIDIITLSLHVSVFLYDNLEIGQYIFIYLTLPNIAKCL